VGDRTDICRYGDGVRVPLRSILLDVLLAVVLTGLTLATQITESDGRTDLRVYVLVALTAAPLALRQLVPVTTMALIVGALAAYGVVGNSSGDVPNGGVGLLVAMFTVATLRSRWVALGAFLVALAVTVTFVATTLVITWPRTVQAVLVLLGAWALGEGTRRWGQRAERLAGEAAHAVADERVRIARELHDVVAHHMSVVSVQSGLAEYVLDSDLPTARKAIGAVGDASREALLEMRRLLDVLRVDHAADSDLLPQPGLASVIELADRARSAGLEVELRISGVQRPLPSGPDLCAYRVVQESLTNVLKHAGAATARIDLDYGERMLTLKVTDNGTSAAAQPASVTSHGIRGMRERAELYGGVLTAGPAVDGGFAVVARLPIEAAA
jgi:signal transduction histidine kinase